MGIGRAVRLRQLVDAGVPMLIGLVRPTIVLPTGLDKRLTSRELEAVLVHELQHVARHDAIVHLVQSLLAVVYFFHPLVWLTNRFLNALREDACDEATVAVLEGQRRDYGAGIVKIAELMSGPTPSMSLGIVESGGQVKRRLGRILDPRLPVGRRLSWSTFALLLLLAAVVLPVAARPGDNPSEPERTNVSDPPRPATELASATDDEKAAAGEKQPAAQSSPEQKPAAPIGSPAPYTIPTGNRSSARRSEFIPPACAPPSCPTGPPMTPITASGPRPTTKDAFRFPGSIRRLRLRHAGGRRWLRA